MSVKAVQYILSRANELGILLWVKGDKVKYRGKAGTIPPKMFEVVKQHKPDLIAYLPTVCVVCQSEVEHYSIEEIAYCQTHYDQIAPSLKPLDTTPLDLSLESDRQALAELYCRSLPGWTVTIEPRCTLAEHIARLEQSKHKERTQDDYWSETHAKLEAQGYYEQVARDEEAFWQRVDEPRVYPAPVPRFELIETDGVKAVVQVGYWDVAGELEVSA